MHLIWYNAIVNWYDMTSAKQKKRLIMKKRLISLILAVIVTIACTTGALATGTSYSDVSKDAWYYTYVTELSNAGVINGYSDGTFRPSGTVTYGEALKLVLSATGHGGQAPTGGHWASGYLAFALEAGYISNITEEDLNRPISRIEIVHLVANASGINEATIESPFADTDDELAVALYEANVVTGSVTDNVLYLRGDSNIIRSEISTIVYRIMNIDSAVEEPEDDVTEELDEDYRIIVTCSGGLNLRSEPNTDSEVIAVLPTGASAKAVSEINGWYEVSYGGSTGYVCGDYCRLVSASDSNYSGLRGELIEYAQQYIGCPYVYGGSGPDEFDCSGFTMYVFEKYGYSLSHSARAQFASGTEISKAELIPGDLVFFSNYETTWIGHVGIYIGNGEFVHASSSKGVIISSMDSDWYSSHYVCSARIIPEV